MYSKDCNTRCFFTVACSACSMAMEASYLACFVAFTVTCSACPVDFACTWRCKINISAIFITMTVVFLPNFQYFFKFNFNYLLMICIILNRFVTSSWCWWWWDTILKSMKLLLSMHIQPAFVMMLASSWWVVLLSSLHHYLHQLQAPQNRPESELWLCASCWQLVDYNSTIWCVYLYSPTSEWQTHIALDILSIYIALLLYVSFKVSLLLLFAYFPGFVYTEALHLYYTMKNF